MCNSHTLDYAKGLSSCIKEIQVKLFINELGRRIDRSTNQKRLTNSRKILTKENSKFDINRSKRSSTTSVSYLSSLNCSSSSLSSSNSQLSYSIGSMGNLDIENKEIKKNESTYSLICRL